MREKERKKDCESEGKREKKRKRKDGDRRERERERERERKEGNTRFVGWLFGFYGISTFVGYLMPNPFYTNKQFYFRQFNLA